MLETVYHVLQTVSAIAALLAPPLYVAFALNKRLAKLEATDEAQEFKIKIIWEWLMREAIRDGLQKGILVQNSPVAATDLIRCLFEPVKQKLRLFYRNIGKTLPNEYDLEMQVVALLGVDFFMKEICLPLGLEKGACIKAAVAIAKEPDDEPQ